MLNDTTAESSRHRSIPGHARRSGRWAYPRMVALAAGLVASLSWGEHALGTPRPNHNEASTRMQPRDAKNDTKAADPVPIRKITLYRSGVGYFERQGGVVGDTQVQLRFKTEQINDILKSMVLLDLSGGRINAVSYGSKEPLARRLASFGVDISGNPSVPDLLNQLRGAPIKVVLAGEPMTGTILGIENRKVSAGKDQQPYDAPHLSIVTETGLRTLAVSDISSFDILDKELAGELNKALAALAEYRADRSKTVDLDFGANGVGGERRVVVGYVHEMPVWKTSYRLILPDEGKGAPADAKSPTLAMQGWAIVENNTDSDWNSVKLSLVSGRPVSFQMDLYEPLYVYRPQIPVPTVPGVAPRSYGAGLDAALFESAAEAMDKQAPARLSALASEGRGRRDLEAGRPMSPAPAASIGAPGGTAGLADAMIDASDMADYAAAAQAQAGEVGEVFQYELEAPVTIERQRSAMIPILSTSISGRRVSIFNPVDGAEHPMRGVELTNDSNLQFLPGPIAVFDGNDNKSAYAGDATIGHIGQGDKRLLAYAVDLDVRAVTSATNNVTITKLRIVDGTMEQTTKTESRTGYAFKNADEKRARTVIVEHPKLEGWKLVTPAEPAEVTQSLYRFEASIAAGKSETVSVVQERVDAQRVAIMSIDTATVLAYHKAGKLSDKVLETYREVGRRQSAINQAERDIADLDRQINEINADQSRIRENMSRIDKTSQLYGRYMTKLNEQETQLEDIGGRKIKAEDNLKTLRTQFNEFVRSLNVE